MYTFKARGWARGPEQNTQHRFQDWLWQTQDNFYKRHSHVCYSKHVHVRTSNNWMMVARSVYRDCRSSGEERSRLNSASVPNRDSPATIHHTLLFRPDHSISTCCQLLPVVQSSCGFALISAYDSVGEKEAFERAEIIETMLKHEL